MKFDKYIASRLVEEGIVSPVTARVWETRGTIPDKYRENPKRREQATPEQVAKTLEKIAHPAISLSEIARRSGIAPQVVADAKAGRQLLSVSECKAIRTEARKLRADIAKACRSWSGVLEFLPDARIKARTALGHGSLYGRLVLAWNGGYANFSEAEEQKVKDLLKVI